jgi:UDP-2-acetamido-3-amino-2,3-dideoxy-glucuronate N-acetyltransferase
MPALFPSALAPGLVVGEGVVIGEGCEIGANVVIRSGVVLGAGCRIEDLVLLGKAPVLAPQSTAGPVTARPLELGAGVIVCSGAVVFAGARVGSGAIVGDQAHVREGVEIGAGSVIGRGSAVSSDARVGARVRVQTNVFLTSGTVVEDDVFFGPGVITGNDHTMARHPPGRRAGAPVLRRACRVGAGAVLLPGVEVGEEAFVTAGAVVAVDVPPRAVVMGVPARVVREVPDEDLLERWR